MTLKKLFRIKLVWLHKAKKKGIDFDMTYSLITRMESMCILLAFADFKNFELFSNG